MSRTLSEHASKELLARLGIAFPREVLAASPAAAVAAAGELGFPVALKLCGEGIAHKTERGLVRLGLGDAAAVDAAARELLAARRPEEAGAELLVAEMLSGRRELIAGLVRDPSFGPCVVLGLGGVLTEALGDVAFAAAPLSRAEARAMLDALAARRLFSEPFRGEPAVDREALADLLVALGRLGVERPDVVSVDLNPVLVCGDRPLAVDALVEIAEPAATEPGASGAAGLGPAEAGASGAAGVETEPEAVLERLRPLFHPRGVVIAGVSSHPGKFGFVAYHNLRAFGFEGELFPVTRDGAELLGAPTLSDVAQVPEGHADLVFVCTPNHVNEALLRACAKRGVRAAFVASGGYGEADEAGRERERELVALAEELGMVVAGPNGQGVISTPRSLCAQIVAPYPPPGSISVASQSGNLVSSFLNYAVETGIGVSKAISAGNSAQLGLADYLEYFAVDPETSVALAYLEGVRDGDRFVRAVRRLTARKPLVLVKGGAAAEGQRAAASHTGALASDDRVFDGLCRQLGVTRAPSVEHAFEWAASFATQPLPRGRRTVVFTTAGGWGVLAADACAAAGLELLALPEDLRAAIDELVPPRWSRANPIDLAGGETRDTIPEVFDLVCGHPEVDAVIHLGLGIQAAQAQLFRSGPFHPDYGLERISDFHDRQDRRYARAAREASERSGKPVLSATELVHTDRHYGPGPDSVPGPGPDNVPGPGPANLPGNAGPRGVREEGRFCHASAHRAIDTLAALCRYAEFRARSTSR